MKTLGQLLGDRPRKPIAVAPDKIVLVALALMEEYDVGALLVMEGEKLVGIFSERDYARKVIIKGKSSHDLAVRDVMTEKVIYADANETVAEAMAIITEKHIRHLPVLDENERVLGVVSVRDLVKETISDQQFLIQQLAHYIAN